MSLLRHFDSPTEPSVTLDAYVSRLVKYLKLDEETLLTVFVYVSRLLSSGTLSSLRPANAHRLVLAGARAASKFLNDVHYDNKYYAEIGGVDLSELNFLELAFCYAAGFRLRARREEVARAAEVIASVGEDDLSASFSRKLSFHEDEDGGLMWLARVLRPHMSFSKSSTPKPPARAETKTCTPTNVVRGKLGSDRAKSKSKADVVRPRRLAFV